MWYAYLFKTEFCFIPYIALLLLLNFTKFAVLCGVNNVIMQVDAFTETAFKGNPAAVCLLEEDKDDEWLQPLAAEFNTPVTCYLIPIHGTSKFNPRFGLRLFGLLLLLRYMLI